MDNVNLIKEAIKNGTYDWKQLLKMLLHVFVKILKACFGDSSYGDIQ